MRDQTASQIHAATRIHLDGIHWALIIYAVTATALALVLFWQATCCPGEPASGNLAMGEYYMYYEDMSEPGSRFVGGRDILVSDKLSRYEQKSWEKTLPVQWRRLPADIVQRGEPIVPGVVKVFREETGLVYEFLSINPRDMWSMAIPNPLSKDP